MLKYLLNRIAKIVLILIIYKTITISTRITYGYISYNPANIKDFTPSDFL